MENIVFWLGLAQHLCNFIITGIGKMSSKILPFLNKKTCTEKNQVMLAGLLRVSGNLSAYNGKYAEKFWNNNSDD